MIAYVVILCDCTVAAGKLGENLGILGKTSISAKSTCQLPFFVITSRALLLEKLQVNLYVSLEELKPKFGQLKAVTVPDVHFNQSFLLQLDQHQNLSSSTRVYDLGDTFFRMQILPRLHSDEFHITLPLIKHLITSQAPSLCHLPLRPIMPGGTDHVVVRLGDSFVARFPRHPGAIPATKVDRQWLPHIQKFMTVSVPGIVYLGNPDPGPESDKAYSAPWSILSYLPGKVATPLNDTVSPATVTSLVESLVDVLKQIRTIRVPAELSSSEVPTSYRTGSLQDRLLHLTTALELCNDVFDCPRVLGTFRYDLLRASPYKGLPVAAHGDLQPANLILGPCLKPQTNDSSCECIVGLIDWSGLSFGDPAVDLLPAWMLLNWEGRQEFKRLLEKEALVNTDMWRRGRAWALSIAIIAYPYYCKTRQDHAIISYRTVQAVLQDADDEGESR